MILEEDKKNWMTLSNYSMLKDNETNWQTQNVQVAVTLTRYT